MDELHTGFSPELFVSMVKKVASFPGKKAAREYKLRRAREAVAYEYN